MHIIRACTTSPPHAPGGVGVAQPGLQAGLGVCEGVGVILVDYIGAGSEKRGAVAALENRIKLNQALFGCVVE